MDAFIRLLLLFVAIALLAGGGFLSYLDSRAETAGLTYAAAIFAMIFAFLSRFKRFKGLGIEAEMWEEKMEQASELVKQLEKLSVATALPIFSIIPRLGRMDSSIPRRERHQIMERLEAVLKEAKIPKQQIEELKRTYHASNMQDQAVQVYEAANQMIMAKQSELSDESLSLKKPWSNEDEAKYKHLQTDKYVLGESGRSLSFIPGHANWEEIPELLEDAIRSLPVFTEAEKLQFLAENSESFEDIRHYAREKKFRRLAVWFDG